MNQSLRDNGTTIYNNSKKMRIQNSQDPIPYLRLWYSFCKQYFLLTRNPTQNKDSTSNLKQLPLFKKKIKICLSIITLSFTHAYPNYYFKKISSFTRLDFHISWQDFQNEVLWLQNLSPSLILEKRKENELSAYIS